MANFRNVITHAQESLLMDLCVEFNEPFPNKISRNAAGKMIERLMKRRYKENGRPKKGRGITPKQATLLKSLCKQFKEKYPGNISCKAAGRMIERLLAKRESLKHGKPPVCVVEGDDGDYRKYDNMLTIHDEEDGGWGDCGQPIGGAA